MDQMFVVVYWYDRHVLRWWADRGRPTQEKNDTPFEKCKYCLFPLASRCNVGLLHNEPILNSCLIYTIVIMQPCSLLSQWVAFVILWSCDSWLLAYAYHTTPYHTTTYHTSFIHVKIPFENVLIDTKLFTYQPSNCVAECPSISEPVTKPTA